MEVNILQNVFYVSQGVKKSQFGMRVNKLWQNYSFREN